MTCDFEDNALAELLPLLASGNDDRFRDALRLLLNAAMVLERQQHLRAAPYERNEERNGFKDKAFQTRVGNLDVRVPQVRDSSFYPRSLEKGFQTPLSATSESAWGWHYGLAEMNCRCRRYGSFGPQYGVPPPEPQAVSKAQEAATDAVRATGRVGLRHLRAISELDSSSTFFFCFEAVKSFFRRAFAKSATQRVEASIGAATVLHIAHRFVFFASLKTGRRLQPAV